MEQVRYIKGDGFGDIPMTPSGVGSGLITRWTYAEYGQFLNVYGIKNGISITFNLKSADDIKSKLQELYKYRDKGYCDEEDVSELEERVRTLSNLEIGGAAPHSLAGISESKGEGKVETVYRDGKPVKVKRRGKQAASTPAQKRAAENARRYAHTPEAEKKRRKSINARGDGKILGDIS